MDLLLRGLIWFCAIGSGLMAGVYFTFSVFVMRALGRIEAPAGIRAMQAINAVIQRSAFLPLFFATTLASAAAVLATLLALPGASLELLIGGVVYVIGMFGCTVAFNVPLNDRLDAVDADSAPGAELWQTYQRIWTRWNHLRTVACTLASILFVVALQARDDAGYTAVTTFHEHVR